MQGIQAIQDKFCLQSSISTTLASSMLQHHVYPLPTSCRPLGALGLLMSEEQAKEFVEWPSESLTILPLVGRSDLQAVEAFCSGYHALALHQLDHKLACHSQVGPGCTAMALGPQLQHIKAAMLTYPARWAVL